MSSQIINEAGTITLSKIAKKIEYCPNHPESVIHTRGVCRKCYRKIHYEEHERERRGNTKHDKHPLLTVQTDVDGYQRIKVREGKGSNDWEKYHRYKMEQKLERKLHSFENVHHKNGNRSDNSDSNLELWVSKQPRGQRPEDLIEYAEWILQTYKPKVNESNINIENTELS